MNDKEGYSMFQKKPNNAVKFARKRHVLDAPHKTLRTSYLNRYILI